MTTINQNELLMTMQQLIDKSRCGIDGFFTDSRTAAKDILQYLETENIIQNEAGFTMKFDAQSKAA